MAVKVVISIIGKPILRKEGRGEGGGEKTGMGGGRRGQEEEGDGGSKKETGEGRWGRGKEEGDSRLLKHF